MVTLWLLIISLCLLFAISSALVALRIQHRLLENARQEREGWQQAQEGRQRTWEVRQGRHILEAEKKLADQLKDARREWRDFASQVQDEQQEWHESVDLVSELARLPHVDEVELALSKQGRYKHSQNWRPPQFYKADLRGQDLSHRYLADADLRHAQLSGVNFYMADLSGASLTSADLSNADLMSANLTSADLRGANLSNANLLVADLEAAILYGAELTGVQNLTAEQLQCALYDSQLLQETASQNHPFLPEASAELWAEEESLVVSLTNDTEAFASLILSETPLPEVSDVSILAVSETPLPETSAVAASISEEALIIAEASDREILAVSETPLPETSAALDDEMPVAEIGAVAIVSASAEPVPEISEPAAQESPRKSGTSRKRSGKGKQAVAGTAQEASLEELLPNKIIQLQDRAAKTRALGGEKFPKWRQAPD